MSHIDFQLDRIARFNPHLNAIITPAPVEPLTTGPLAGRTVVHKDLFATRGLRTTYGSPIFRDYIPTHDDPLVTRCRNLGLTLLGKTNTSEFGAGAQTFNTLFGPTRNPYDSTKTCGGSSGGSAVAVATGMADFGTGTDFGGSLRIPAAFCNIVGFRPSTTQPGQLDTQGFLARTVADLQQVLELPTLPPPGTRLAWYHGFDNLPFAPTIAAVIAQARHTLSHLGFHITSAEPSWHAYPDTFKTLRAHHAALAHGARYATRAHLYKDTLRAEIARGLALPPSAVQQAQARHREIQQSFAAFLTDFDYFLSPVTLVPPFDVDLPYLSEYNGTRFSSYIDWFAPTWYISLTGAPAISVPAGFTPDGLPVGLQITGRPGHDASVLALASVFTEANPLTKGVHHPHRPELLPGL